MLDLLHIEVAYIHAFIEKQNVYKLVDVNFQDFIYIYIYIYIYMSNYQNRNKYIIIYALIYYVYIVIIILVRRDESTE
jgi:hypothetical protein